MWQPCGSHVAAMWLLWFLLLAPTAVIMITFKGFQFHDNLDEYRWQEDNGIVVYKSNTFLPPALTTCMRVNGLYSRHGDQMHCVIFILQGYNLLRKAKVCKGDARNSLLASCGPKQS